MAYITNVPQTAEATAYNPPECPEAKVDTAALPTGLRLFWPLRVGGCAARSFWFSAAVCSSCVIVLGDEYQRGRRFS